MLQLVREHTQCLIGLTFSDFHIPVTSKCLFMSIQLMSLLLALLSLGLCYTFSLHCNIHFYKRQCTAKLQGDNLFN